MSEFKSCPVCQEESEQCLTCASYVVDGERIYYEKLKDFGATQDYELRFIQRIQKHRTKAFFHKGKLYIPSRQGRAVPLAIGLQWEAWQEQQAKVEELKASHHGEVIGHEVHFKKIKQERDELQTLYIQQGINMLKLQKQVEALTQTMEEVLEEMKYPTATFEEVIVCGVKVLEQALKGEKE
ncbi:hypothetical protein W9I_03259 [Acinetobacter nosocomialis Ab22222]|uniref:hypothetical protein n=1 Tax=Acinetobacter nosocomialis TaxID=106654 RepID=UPI00028DE50E|nr:hypothetical protein [Acinetobacter nosocomialis]EKF46111.1 hypothetical protein W9I_03259 [Acinetobacter nosocomialis Ab22222]